MRQIVLIFIGGGAGSVLRFLVSDMTKNLWKAGSFPTGTFIVNILGCFLMGCFIQIFAKTDSHLKFLLITGFCGGFTTFSALSAENYTLYQSGNYTVLVVYTILSFLIGFLAVLSGLKLSSII